MSWHPQPLPLGGSVPSVSAQEPASQSKPLTNPAGCLSLDTPRSPAPPAGQAKYHTTHLLYSNQGGTSGYPSIMAGWCWVSIACKKLNLSERWTSQEMPQSKCRRLQAQETGPGVDFKGLRPGPPSLDSLTRHKETQAAQHNG